MLKPGLENFEHYFTSMWDECNCAVLWAFFGIVFLWDWSENGPFPVLWPLLSFPFWRRSALDFFGTNDAKAETPVLWPCHAKSWLIGKDWCWEGLEAGREGDIRGWDGWMASLTRWTWVWVNSGSWWWTGRPGMLRFMGSRRVRQDWVTELNWINLACITKIITRTFSLLNLLTIQSVKKQTSYCMPWSRTR